MISRTNFRFYKTPKLGSAVVPLGMKLAIVKRSVCVHGRRGKVSKDLRDATNMTISNGKWESSTTV